MQLRRLVSSLLSCITGQLYKDKRRSQKANIGTFLQSVKFFCDIISDSDDIDLWYRMLITFRIVYIIQYSSLSYLSQILPFHFSLHFTSFLITNVASSTFLLILNRVPPYFSKYFPLTIFHFIWKLMSKTLVRSTFLLILHLNYLFKIFDFFI